MFSHSFRTGITLGYAKSTPSSDMKQHLKDLCACAHQIRHPLLLPLIILSGSLSSETDQKQREARDWLRSLEHAISMRTALSDEQSKYVRDYVVDIDEINRDLAECYARVLWKRPQAYREVIEGMRSAMNRFWCLAGEDPAYGGSGGEVGKLHQSILARLEFYNSRLKGMENYAHVTLERLMIQRAAVCPPLHPTPLPGHLSPKPNPSPSPSSSTSWPKKTPSSASKWPANSAASRKPPAGRTPP